MLRARAPAVPRLRASSPSGVCSRRTTAPFAVASTALGGIAYLADYAIGASIAMSYGFTNAVASVLAAAVVIFLTGIPIARACAANGVDMDLLTRGSGFGYFGSTSPR